jgi:VanZ family protein
LGINHTRGNCSQVQYSHPRVQYSHPKTCYAGAMSIILKLIAWCLAAAVAFATLGPPGYRPHASLLGQDGEHALAFVLLGLAFGLAYSRNRLFAAGIAVGLTGLLEILQFWAPGRHARLEDFLVDALAACVGLAAAAVFDVIVKRTQRSNASAS